MWARTALGEASAFHAPGESRGDDEPSSALGSGLAAARGWLAQPGIQRPRRAQSLSGGDQRSPVASPPGRSSPAPATNSVNGVLFETPAAGALVPLPWKTGRRRRVRSPLQAALLERVVVGARRDGDAAGGGAVHSTGMLRLLRRKLMSGSDTSVEAEVLLSGLVAAPPGRMTVAVIFPLEMAADVRQILLENAPVERVLDVLHQVAARVPLPGINSETFESWLVQPSSGQEQLNPVDEVAAQVAAVLAQIGGPSARIVHPNARRAPVVPDSPPARADAPGPESTPAADCQTRGHADRKLRAIRVFVSSAQDAAEERAVVREVVDEVNARAVRRLEVRLEPVMGEFSPGDDWKAANQAALESSDVRRDCVGSPRRREGGIRAGVAPIPTDRSAPDASLFRIRHQGGRRAGKVRSRAMCCGSGGRWKGWGPPTRIRACATSAASGSASVEAAGRSRDARRACFLP